MGTNIADSIASALFPGSRRAILGLLYGHPDREYYLREIIDRTGLGTGQAQRELARLSQAEILRRFEKGRHVYFQANTECPIYEELRGMVAKTMGAVTLIRNELESWRDRIRVAFVYGSVARGDESAESDLDLMAVGDISFAELVESLSEAESALRREIHSSVFSPDEFCGRLADGDHFLGSVLRQKKIFLIGDENELGKLCPEPVVTRT